MGPRMKWFRSNFMASCDILKARSIEVETVDCVGLGHGIDLDGLSAAIEFLARYLPAKNVLDKLFHLTMAY